MGLLPFAWFNLHPFNTTHFIRVRCPPSFGCDVRWHSDFKFRRIENGTTHNDIKVRTFSISPYGSMFTNNHKKPPQSCFQGSKMGTSGGVRLGFNPALNSSLKQKAGFTKPAFD